MFCATGWYASTWRSVSSRWVFSCPVLSHGLLDYYYSCCCAPFLCPVVLFLYFWECIRVPLRVWPQKSGRLYILPIIRMCKFLEQSIKTWRQTKNRESRYGIPLYTQLCYTSAKKIIRSTHKTLGRHTNSHTRSSTAVHTRALYLSCNGYQTSTSSGRMIDVIPSCFLVQVNI